MTSEEKLTYWAWQLADCLQDEFFIAQRPAFMGNESVDGDKLAEFIEQVLTELQDDK